MGIQLPESLQWLAYLTGGEWPQGDESAMFRIGESWHRAAEELSELVSDLHRVREETTTVLAGETAETAQAEFAKLFDGDFSVPKLVDAMAAMGDAARSGGTQIEYTKLQVITSLAIAGAEILYALAMAPFTFGGSLAWIPPLEAITMAVVRQLLVQLLKRLAATVSSVVTRTAVKQLAIKGGREAIQEVAIGLGQEIGIQGFQKSRGHRDALDWTQIRKVGVGSAAGGFAGGAIHGPLRGVVGRASSVAGKAAKGGMIGFGAGVFGNVIGSVASEGSLPPGGLDALSVLGGASTSAVIGGLHGTGHPEGSRNSPHLQDLLGHRDHPTPTAPVITGIVDATTTAASEAAPSAAATASEIDTTSRFTTGASATEPDHLATDSGTDRESHFALGSDTARDTGADTTSRVAGGAPASTRVGGTQPGAAPDGLNAPRGTDSRRTDTISAAPTGRSQATPLGTITPAAHGAAGASAAATGQGPLLPSGRAAPITTAGQHAAGGQVPARVHAATPLGTPTGTPSSANRTPVTAAGSTTPPGAATHTTNGTSSSTVSTPGASGDLAPSAYSTPASEPSPLQPVLARPTGVVAQASVEVAPSPTTGPDSTGSERRSSPEAPVRTPPTIAPLPSVRPVPVVGGVASAAALPSDGQWVGHAEPPRTATKSMALDSLDAGHAAASHGVDEPGSTGTHPRESVRLQELATRQPPGNPHRTDEHPSPPPRPALPDSVRPHVTLDAAAAVTAFRSGETGDAGLSHIRQAVLRQGGAKVWENNRAVVTALFSDDSIRPQAPGMLRGGRTIVHHADLGHGQVLRIELRLDGDSSDSALHERSADGDEKGNAEFEHTADSTTEAGSHFDDRGAFVAGVQGAVSHTHISSTAALFVARERQRVLNQQRGDRQISGAKTEEPATRFEGSVQAVITVDRRYSDGRTAAHPQRRGRRLQKKPPPDMVRRPKVAAEVPVTIPYWTEVVVPTRELAGHGDVGTQPDVGGPPPGGPRHRLGNLGTRLLATRALHGSDTVSSLWLISDDAFASPSRADDADLAGGAAAMLRNPTASQPMARQSVADLLASAPMAAAFRTAFGAHAEHARREMSSWLTVELLQAKLHGMTNKQALTKKFETVPGGRVEVHAFIEPLGTPSNSRTASLLAATHAPGRLAQPAGTTKKTEFHHGSETDVQSATQDVVTWSAQVPIPGRVRGNGGSETGEAVFGVDGAHSWAIGRTETRSRQFRMRNTLKSSLPGQAWCGQVRLRVVLHGATATAVHETRGSFKAMSERVETSEDFTNTEVWAPPRRIWGDPPAAEPSADVEGSPPPGRRPAPLIRRGETPVPARGMGSMDRVTNLDISGFHGMLESMGRRAFGSAWQEVGPQVASWHHLDRVRAALPGMTQGSPLTPITLTGADPSSVAVTADFHQLTFKRVTNSTISPGYERTEGVSGMVTRTAQGSSQVALGGRGGDVAGGPVLGEAIAGKTTAARSSDRVRNRTRAAVQAKIDQRVALFEGWVELSVTIAGPRTTVHGSGLFPVGIAIPLTEAHGRRMHHTAVAPTFTRSAPNGYVGPLPVGSNSTVAELDWTPSPRIENPPQPPQHALSEAWHPTDVIVGLERASGLIEAIRQDLAPLLGDRVDDAITSLAPEFGPDVLAARLAFESGRQWSHQVPAPGGFITVRVRPVREPHHDYVGPSDKFEHDVMTETQSATATLESKLTRRVLGARVQVPVPHGSLTLQLSNSHSVRPGGAVAGDAGDAGHTTEADTGTATADTEARTVRRTKNVQPSELYRQPIRFELSYEAHLRAVRLTHRRGHRAAPPPVTLHAVFAYPRALPTADEGVAHGFHGAVTRPLRLTSDQTVVAVRPHTLDAPMGSGAQSSSERTPDEDLIATHVLNAAAAQGRAIYGLEWPRVRAELAPHVNTLAVQERLQHAGARGTTTVELRSVRGGRVVLGGRIDGLGDATPAGTSEFFDGGQTVRSIGMSDTQARSWQGFLQAQGDLIPGSNPLNVSMLGRVDVGGGHETVDTATGTSATGLHIRHKKAALARTGSATVEVAMSRPGDPDGTGARRQRNTWTRVLISTREISPVLEVPSHVVDGDRAGRQLTHHSVVRDITNGEGFRSRLLAHLRSAVGLLTFGMIEGDVRSAFSDARLTSYLPAMTRGEVEMFRRGSLRITGRAVMQPLGPGRATSGDSAASSLNEVSQARMTQGARFREGGARVLAGPHWSLADFQGSLWAGGGGTRRRRLGAMFGEAAKVTANVKSSQPSVLFDGTAHLTFTVHDGAVDTSLPGIDLHGPILVPSSEARRIDQATGWSTAENDVHEAGGHGDVGWSGSTDVHDLERGSTSTARAGLSREASQESGARGPQVRGPSAEGWAVDHPGSGPQTRFTFDLQRIDEGPEDSDWNTAAPQASLVPSSSVRSGALGLPVTRTADAPPVSA